MTILSEAMRRALDEAADAMLRGEVPVGAVITDAGGRIVAADGNRTRHSSIRPPMPRCW